MLGIYLIHMKHLLPLLEEILRRILAEVTFAPRGAIYALVKPKVALDKSITSRVITNLVQFR